MSQIYKTSTGGTPGSGIQQLTPDVGGAVLPSGGNVNVNSSTSNANTTAGIRTSNGGSSILDISLTNRAVGSTTTNGAGTAILIALPLGTTPGVYTFDITVAAFAKTGVGAPGGAGYTIVGSVRTDGTTATLIPTQVVDHFEETILQNPNEPSSALGVSGNNAIVSVTGKFDGASGYVIDWQGTLTYTFAS